MLQRILIILLAVAAIIVTLLPGTVSFSSSAPPQAPSAASKPAPESVPAPEDDPAPAAAAELPQAYIMGDSLIDDLEKNGLYDAFRTRGWHAEIRARRGRTILNWSRPSGLEQAISDMETIRQSHAVVIGLGVNKEPGLGAIKEPGDNFYPFTELMKKLLGFLKSVMPDNSRIYWLSIYDKGKPLEATERNHAMRHLSTKAGYEFTIFPWHTKIVENPGWLEDQIHLRPYGSWNMNQLIAEQVTQ